MNLSIRKKYMLGMLIIFISALVVIMYYSNALVKKNNEQTILKDLIKVKRNSVVYIIQYFSINKLEYSSENFHKNANKIIIKLSEQLEEDIGFYSVKGSLICDSNKNDDIGEILNNEFYKNINSEDLKLACRNKISYTIRYDRDEVNVYFSYPLIVKGENVGILRYIKNYEELYKAQDKLINMILFVIAILFLVIIIFSFILFNGITVPLIRLRNCTREICKGNYNVKIDIKSDDEIGDLAKDFSKMSGSIQKHVETIEIDRRRLENLEEHRKIFFDNVTHELKTPLTTILGYSQIIKDNGFNDEEFFNKGMEHIESESKRLHKMVIELLELSKANYIEGVCEFKRIDVANVIDITCEGLNIKAKRYNIVIEKYVDRELWVNGNEYRLKQLLINIIDNAIKYGKVGAFIRIKATKSNSCIGIVVEDEGRGIPKDKLDKIFEPFFRVDKKSCREKGSNGLGLAIAKAIVEEHGGNIQIESVELIGTTVKIIIPQYGSC